MRQRIFGLEAALGVGMIGAALATAPVIAQTPPSAAKAAAGAKAWTPSRTVDGQPDLQGVWNFSTPTPLERPDELAGREVLTDEEIAAAADRAASRDRRNPVPEQDVGQAYNEFWSERGRPIRRTSLILDPADGKLPPFTADGRKRAEAGARRGTDGPEQRSLWERCLTRSGLPRIPGAYNDNVQIFQTRDHVVLLYEMIHEPRIIPVDGRAHIAQNVRQWLGDSRGRWEGDTLAVETTNFNDEARVRGSSADMRLIERFRRVDADTIDYQFTVEDPTTWTKPWTATLPMNRVHELIYEYSCHEGNYAMFGILEGAREADKAAAEAAKRGSSR